MCQWCSDWDHIAKCHVLNRPDNFEHSLAFVVYAPDILFVKLVLLFENYLQAAEEEDEEKIQVKRSSNQNKLKSILASIVDSVKHIS